MLAMTSRRKAKIAAIPYYYVDMAKARKIVEPMWYKLIGGAKGRAKKNGFAYDLDFSWAKDKWTGYCEVSGLAFIQGTKSFCGYSPSIDRIDPSRGYVKSNCRFILMSLNSMKGSMSESEFQLLLKRLAVQVITLDRIDFDLSPFLGESNESERSTVSQGLPQIQEPDATAVTGDAGKSGPGIEQIL